MIQFTRRRALALATGAGAAVIALRTQPRGPLLRRLFGDAVADSPAGRAIVADIEAREAKRSSMMNEDQFIRMILQSSTIVAWSEGRGTLDYDRLFLPYDHPCANMLTARHDLKAPA